MSDAGAKRRLIGNEPARDRCPFGKGSVAIAVFWLALYGYIITSAAITSLGGTTAVAQSAQ